MIAYLLIALAMVSLLVTEAAGQTLTGGASFGSSGGGSPPPPSGTLFNDATLNIFDTYDPLCDPDTAAANGIIFCDGFEDGSLGGTNQTTGISSDGWYFAKSGAPGGDCTGESCVDIAGTNFTECNSNVSDTGKADFGAAGTPCAATQGWARRLEPSHCFRAPSGNPIACASSSGYEVQHLRVRAYFKLSGVSSTRCPAGYPFCPEFLWWVGDEGTNTNGVKFIENRDGLDTGGISYLLLATDFEPHGDLLFGGIDYVDSPNGSNIGKTCMDGEAYCRQHLGSLSWYDALDHWVFLEYEIKQENVDDGSTLRLWMDDCGADGLGCTGDPTLRIEVSNIDIIVPQTGSQASRLPDALYLNSWNQGSTQGEIQWDEIVVRDGAVLDAPIGFFKGCLSGGC